VVNVADVAAIVELNVAAPAVVATDISRVRAVIVIPPSLPEVLYLRQELTMKLQIARAYQCCSKLSKLSTRFTQSNF
jgi:hypothetical protein